MIKTYQYKIIITHNCTDKTYRPLKNISGIFAPGDGGSIFSAPPLTKVLQALDQQCSFQSYSTLYNDTGLFGVVFTTFRPEITPQIIDVIQNEIRRIAFDLSDGKN